jgi:hypothetical protein
MFTGFGGWGRDGGRREGATRRDDARGGREWRVPGRPRLRRDPHAPSGLVNLAHLPQNCWRRLMSGPNLPTRNRILPSPRGTSGEGSGEGPLVGRQFDPRRRAVIRPRDQGASTGLQVRKADFSVARRVRRRNRLRAALPRNDSLERRRERSTRDRILPSSRGTSGEGPGEGPTCGRQLDAFRRAAMPGIVRFDPPLSTSPPAACGWCRFV